MTQNLIDGIVNALYSKFGDNYTYYTESVSQDLNTPCFFVLPISEIETNEIGRRFNLTMQIQIRFIPSDVSYSSLLYVSQQLRDALASITVGDYSYRPEDITMQPVDEALVCIMSLTVPYMHDDASDVGMMQTNTNDVRVI